MGSSLRCSVCGLNYPHRPSEFKLCLKCEGPTSWSSNPPNVTPDEIAELRAPAPKYPDVFLDLSPEQQEEWERDWRMVDRLVERSGGRFGDAEVWPMVGRGRGAGG